MESNLVIVESPAKAKTIKKILGADFIVKSSYGHVRDLSKKNMGVDIAADFEPDYEISSDKQKVVSDLRKTVAKVKTVWLASDEDREGEAISWHLTEVLNLKNKDVKRIVFHEITKQAIEEAVRNPREIDINLVNAQQARRVLDRLVGFSLSPLLWKKIKPALSAGRVQSVAVKLIVEREREINKFTTSSAYKVTAVFAAGNDVIKADLNQKLKTEADVKAFLEKCKDQEFSVVDVVKKPGKKTPAPPFTTSTLQQEAGRKLGYSVAQTMRLAQSLYEHGHITYMRTDSVNLSNLALGTTKSCVETTFGEKYYKFRTYRTKSKGAQEAHEAIRPTYIDNEVLDVPQNEQRLYDLIRKRTLATQMQDAKIEKTTVTIKNGGGDITFVANGEVVIFDGFLKLYRESLDDENEEAADVLSLPELPVGTPLSLNKMEAVERYEQPPYRYTEASLVKKMEELGIGRPSTYAPTISTIQQREYIVKENRPAKTRDIKSFTLENKVITDKMVKEKYGAESNKLFPTSIGLVVTDYLVEHFDNILNYNFTARIEEEFDDIAMGKKVWKKMIANFYKPFSEQVALGLQEKETTRFERRVGEHPETGLPIFLRVGKYGPYAVIDDGQKPLYASLRKNQNVENITLEEVLELFKLPRNIGTYNDDDVIVAIGKYGPYLKNNGKFYSLKKTDDPYTININRGVELIEEKNKSASQPYNRTFAEMPGLQILKGRYGPYISYEKKNYHIPNSIDPDSITLEQCQKIISQKKKK